MNIARLLGIIPGVLSLAFLGGCYDAQEVNSFLLKPRKPISGIEYRVLPPDAIQVVSRHVPEITGVTQVVSPAGKINLPLVGELYVANKTPREIELAITEAAKDFYEQVDVTVTVVAYNSQKYFVFGEVGRPGPETWTGHDTLLDALAKAQPTFLAWPERILVVRGDDPQEGGREEYFNSKQYKNSGVNLPEVNNPRRILTFNLMAMVEKGDLSNNIILKPNDVIYVQPNPLARLGLAIQSLLYPVRPMIEAAGTPYRIGNVGSYGGY